MGRRSLCKPNRFKFSLSVEYHPHQKKKESLCPSPHHRPHIGEKLLLIAFRFILPKNFCLQRTFSVTQSWLIWKSLLEPNPLIQNNVLQDYLPELYPLYFCSYPKKWPKTTPPLISLCCPHQVWTVPRPSPKPLQTKNVLISCHQK